MPGIAIDQEKISPSILPKIDRNKKVATLPNGKNFRLKQFEVGNEPEDLDQFIYVEGFASTSSVDDAGDIILPEFWQGETVFRRFLKNPILLFNHSFNEIVGNVYWLDPRPEGLFVRAKVSRSWSKAWQVEQKLLKSFSVRVDLDLDGIDYDFDRGVFLLSKGSLIELSLASVPMNEDTTFDLAKSLENETLDRQELKNLCKNKNFKTMDISKFFKDLAGFFKSRFNVEVEASGDELTAEDFTKTLEDLPTYEDRIKSIREDVLKSIQDDISEGESETAKSFRKSIIDQVRDDIIAEATKGLNEQIEELQSKNKQFENQILKMKGRQADGTEDLDEDPLSGLPKTGLDFKRDLTNMKPGNGEVDI